MAIPMAWSPSRRARLAMAFAAALKDYQACPSPFRVLCSVHADSIGDGDNEQDIQDRMTLASPPQQMPRSLLVLDSSFNPPTLAHQRMALSALREDDHSTNSRVLLLLAIRNADKAPKPADFPHRLAMMYMMAQDLLPEALAVDIAVTTEPFFHSKCTAIAESGFYHREPSHRGAAMEQVYLTGFDTLIRILDPKYYDEGAMAAMLDPLFSRSRIRVTMRPDGDWGNTADQLRYARDLRSAKYTGDARPVWADRIEMTEGEGKKSGSDEIVVSSTRVRAAAQKGDWDALRMLVSERVCSWIREEKLYQDE